MMVGVLIIIAMFLVVATMLSRQSSKTKKQAIEDLKVDKADVGTFDIFELVESEIASLGLLEIAGASEISHAVLLKVWSASDDVVSSCAGREHLRYVIAGEINPSDATEDDVTLECTNPENT